MSLTNFFKNLFSLAPPSKKDSHPLDGPMRVKEAPYKIETPEPTVIITEYRQPEPAAAPAAEVPAPVVESVPAAEPAAVEPAPVKRKPRKTAEKAKPAVKKPAEKAKPASKKSATAPVAKKTRGRKPRAK